MKKYDLVVIGGGSAGIASAISAYDQGIRSIIVLEKDAHLGGILMQCIHNGFGLHRYQEELTGPEYAERNIEELTARKIEYKTSTMVTKITKELEIHYSNVDGYEVIQARAIILATGCMERTRGQIATPGSRVAGIMTAGLAQKYINIDGYMVGKRVFILGSGDIGLIMARRLTLEGTKVLGVAEIMPYSNGLSRNIVQCINDYNIPLYLSHTVKRIIGKDHVEKIILAKVDEQFNFIEGSEIEFEVDCLLLSVGLIPSIPLLDNINVVINPKTKGPDVDESLMTSIPGIFACGNSLHVHDLVDFVSLEGEKVGIAAAKYLKEELVKEKRSLILKPSKGIHYILPSIINLNNIEEINLNFRVNAPVFDCYLRVILNNQEIKKVRKSFMLPAEMESIKLNINDLQPGVLELEVVHA